MVDHGAARQIAGDLRINGDLARKMTFRALYRLERHQLLTAPSWGVASDDTSCRAAGQRARVSPSSYRKIDDAVPDRLAGRLSYLHRLLPTASSYDSLAELIGHLSAAVLPEMPPALFAPIVENLANVRLLERARVAVEKAVRPRPGLRARTQRPAASGVGRRPILRDHFL